LFLKSLNPIRRIKELAQELRRALEQRDQALQDKQRLESENARLREEIERLQKELEGAQRAARRQAAPFSRGQRKSHPKSPGRKPGARYGTHHRRPVPERVDEEIAVPVPVQCPACAGLLTLERIEPQYQEEIVRRTWVTFPSAGVRSVESVCRGGIHYKPPMRSEQRRCRWGRRR
jgi:DNA repair exonuclease SbcCD ATPase subunit